MEKRSQGLVVLGIILLMISGAILLGNDSPDASDSSSFSETETPTATATETVTEIQNKSVEAGSTRTPTPTPTPTVTETEQDEKDVSDSNGVIRNPKKKPEASVNVTVNATVK